MDDGQNYRVILEVPGATKEDLEVSPGPAPGTLAVRVSVRKGATPTTGTLLHAERQARDGHVAFARVVPVAWNADVSKASSRLSAGLLEVTVPKNVRPTTESTTSGRSTEKDSSSGKKNKS